MKDSILSEKHLALIHKIVSCKRVAETVESSKNETVKKSKYLYYYPEAQSWAELYYEYIINPDLKKDFMSSTMPESIKVGIKSPFNEAFKYYSKAIKSLESTDLTNPLLRQYYLDRSKLFVDNRDYKLAAGDVIKSAEIPKTKNQSLEAKRDQLTKEIVSHQEVLEEMVNLKLSREAISQMFGVKLSELPIIPITNIPETESELSPKKSGFGLKLKDLLSSAGKAALSIKKMQSNGSSVSKKGVDADTLYNLQPQPLVLSIQKPKPDDYFPPKELELVDCPLDKLIAIDKLKAMHKFGSREHLLGNEPTPLEHDKRFGEKLDERSEKSERSTEGKRRSFDSTPFRQSEDIRESIVNDPLHFTYPQLGGNNSDGEEEHLNSKSHNKSENVKTTPPNEGNDSGKFDDEFAFGDMLNAVEIAMRKHDKLKQKYELQKKLIDVQENQIKLQKTQIKEQDNTITELMELNEIQKICISKHENTIAEHETLIKPHEELEYNTDVQNSSSSTDCAQHRTSSDVTMPKSMPIPIITTPTKSKETMPINVYPPKRYSGDPESINEEARTDYFKPGVGSSSSWDNGWFYSLSLIPNAKNPLPTVDNGETEISPLIGEHKNNH